MQNKWVLLSFVLGLGVVLDVTPARSQFGEKGGKGGKGERTFTFQPSGGSGATPNVVAPGGFGGGGNRGGGFGGTPPSAGFNGAGGGFNGGGGFGGTPPGGFGGGSERGGKGGDRGGFGGSPNGGFGGGAPGGGGNTFGGSKGGERGERGGPGGRPQIDPETSWAMLVKVSGGTNTVKFDNIPPDTKRMLKMFAERSGTPALPDSGEWSKDQFMAHANASAELLRMGGSGNGPGNNWGAGGERGGDNFDPRSTVRGGREKKDEEEERPVAIRYGKLPKDSPAMFTEMDNDKDGQIGMYEWRVSGNSLIAFQEMDLNGDGLLTVEEYGRYTQLKSDREKAIAYENGETPAKSGASGRGTGMPGRGGPTGKSGGDTPNYFGPTGEKSKDGSNKEEKRNGKDGGGSPGRGLWGGGDSPRPTGKK